MLIAYYPHTTYLPFAVRTYHTFMLRLNLIEFLFNLAWESMIRHSELIVETVEWRLVCFSMTVKTRHSIASSPQTAHKYGWLVGLDAFGEKAVVGKDVFPVESCPRNRLAGNDPRAIVVQQPVVGSLNQYAAQCTSPHTPIALILGRTCGDGELNAHRTRRISLYSSFSTERL